MDIIYLHLNLMHWLGIKYRKKKKLEEIIFLSEQLYQLCADTLKMEKKFHTFWEGGLGLFNVFRISWQVEICIYINHLSLNLIWKTKHVFSLTSSRESFPPFSWPSSLVQNVCFCHIKKDLLNWKKPSWTIVFCLFKISSLVLCRQI